MLSLPVRESVTRDTTRAGFMSRNFLTKREIANYFLVGSDRTEVMQARPCLSHLSSLVNLHIVQCLLLTLEVNITASRQIYQQSSLPSGALVAGGGGGVLEYVMLYCPHLILM